MEKYTIPAIKLTQKEASGHELFFGKIKAKDLLDPEDSDRNARFEIHKWESRQKDEPGYQRFPNQGRIEKLKKYIQVETQSPIFPTTLLVNARSPVNFKSKSSDDDIGELEIDQKLYIIDGQHRIEAFKDMMQNESLRSKYGYMELPIVILSNFKYIEEVEHFFIINSKQKKIKTDLAQRIFLELGKDDINTKLVPDKDKWQMVGVKVVDSLNNDPSSIWYQQIILPDDASDVRREKLVSQNSFTKSLKPFFTGSTKRWDFPAEGDSTGQEILKELTEVLESYWRMIKGIYPESFTEKKKSILFKTVGVFSLHLILAEYMSKHPQIGLEELISDLKELFEYARDENKFTPEFWQSGNKEAREKGMNAGAYSSSAGHNRIAMAILNKKKINEF
jgi:DGQHR domain-containing protein